MELKYVEGDILSNIDPNEKTVIVHGCNVFHIMGKGLALYFRKKYPGIYEADCKTRKGDRDKLGTYSVYKHTDNLVFLNCYTQYNIYNDKYGQPPIDYDAIMRCFVRISEEYRDWKIRSPQIGCGFAGGLWCFVEKILKTAATAGNLDITVYYLRGDHATLNRTTKDYGDQGT